MSDLRIRNLERQAAAGDPRAESALLSERLRTGDLSQAYLRFAAYCGSAAALDTVDKPDWCYKCESACFYTVGETRTGASRCPGCLDFSAWFAGLGTLGADLDRLGLQEQKCLECGGGGMAPCDHREDRTTTKHDDTCLMPCTCDRGLRRVPWQGSRWITVKAVTIAGWLTHAVSCPFDYCPALGCPITDALELVDNYLEEGTQRTFALCDPEASGLNAIAAPWAWWVLCIAHGASPATPALMLQAAARVVGVAPCKRCPAQGCPPGRVWEDGSPYAGRMDCPNCNGTSRMDGEVKLRAGLSAKLIEWAL